MFLFILFAFHFLMIIVFYDDFALQNLFCIKI